MNPLGYNRISELSRFLLQHHADGTRYPLKILTTAFHALFQNDLSRARSA